MTTVATYSIEGGWREIELVDAQGKLEREQIKALSAPLLITIKSGTHPQREIIARALERVIERARE